jgi:CRP/FNR family transcriptional regulator
MTEKSKFWHLNNISLFEGMPDSTMSAMDKMSSMSNVKSHQPIYFPDDHSHAIFFLKQGHVKISRIHSDGREVILDVIGPGEVFGELSLADDEQPASEMAQALDDVLICTVRKEDFEMLLAKNPQLNLQITKRIGLRLRKFEERVTDLLFKDTRKRLATFLVRYAEEFGKIKSGTVTVPMHLSHQEIALLTGAARQTVTTTLNELRNDGLIDFTRKELIVNQMEKLKAVAR